jgi:release factor glutamine methyltransferase
MPIAAMRRWHSITLRHAHHYLSAAVNPSACRPRNGPAARHCSASAEPAVLVPTPLCYRPAQHDARLQDILDWRSQQTSAIASIGDTFLEQDGGPSASDLLRELEWVLDDTIAAYCTPPAAGPAGPGASTSTSTAPAPAPAPAGAGGPAWQPVQWRDLAPELDHAARNRRDTSGWRLLCRAPPQELHALWQRRLQERAPFQYLIHTAHWHKYVLAVGPGVLVPRPETEIFAELAAEALQRRPELGDRPWLDLGTGSGAIAIAAADALRRHRPPPPQPAEAAAAAAPRVWAVDLSPVAVAYARHNARLAGLQALVAVAQGSWYGPVQQLAGQLGAVLSNPPYIPREQMPGLQAEVGLHEPWGALDGGGRGGLASLRAICSGAVEMLAPGGLIALETAGGQQAHAVAELLAGPACGRAFEEVAVRDDCYGVPRFVVGHRKGRRR